MNGQALSAAARASARRLYYEAQLHWTRLRSPRRRPCVVIFPSNQPWDAASNLRAWLVGPALEKLGWRVVLVPEPLNLRQRKRLLRRERPDVILLQQTRHPLNRPHLYRPIPCVLDADDADVLDPRHHDSIVAAAAGARAVIGGSRFVARQLGRHNSKIHVLWTCTPQPDAPPAIPQPRRRPIVAWAHSEPLRTPHEAALVRRVMTKVCQRTRCIFWLFGTAESEASEWFAPIRQAGGECRAISVVPYDVYLAEVAQAAVGLQPLSVHNEFARGKSFGKLLAYLAGQVAVVASDAVDHPVFFRDGETAFLLPEVEERWVEAIVRLIEDPELRARFALAAWEDFQGRLTTGVFAHLLDPILREAMLGRAEE